MCIMFQSHLTKYYKLAILIVSKGIIITYEQFDKAKIRSELKTDVLLLSEYLGKEKKR
jgi:hypothetical protein